MSQYYTKEITFEVVSKGRKYFKIRYSPDHNEFQLVIDDRTRDFKPGDRVEGLLCEFETQVNSYTGGKKTTATAVDPVESAKRLEAAKEAEIERWRGYVEEALSIGRIYAKGYNRLQELGFDLSIYKDREKEIADEKRQSEITRWSGYCESSALEGQYYHKGLKKLEELGAAEIAQQFRDQAAQVVADRAEKTEAERKAAGIVRYWFGSPAWQSSEELTHLQVGDVYKSGNEYFTILTREYQRVREDGLSFGLADDAGEIIRGTARAATPAESAPLIEAEKRQKAKREQQHIRTEERRSLINLICENNNYNPSSADELHCAGELLLSTVTPYGGGDWFEIDPVAGEIWYCKNNGGDGDCWDWNNVRTWGAGAIGYRISYNQEIADRIRKLVELNDDL